METFHLLLSEHYSNEMSRKMALLCQEEILLQKFYNAKVWPKKYLISEITLGINVASKIEEMVFCYQNCSNLL